MTGPERVKRKHVLVLGAGGHGRVVADALAAMGGKASGFLDPDPALKGLIFLGVPVLGGDELLERMDPENTILAIGSGIVSVRRRLFGMARDRGFEIATVIPPSAVVASEVVIGQGAQILAGAVVGVGSVVDENVLVNTGARVDHDCRLGAHCHVGPGAVLCGEVMVGDSAFLGAGAVANPGIRVGGGAVAGSGAVLVKDVPPDHLALGIPASCTPL